MKKRIYILGGIFSVFLLLGTFFVFKVFGSENLTNISECTPYNVDLSKGEEENTVEISWSTKEKCSGYILYGSEMKNLKMVGVDLENEVESEKHMVLLTGLLSSKKYYFSIISDSTIYGKEGLPIQFIISSL